ELRAVICKTPAGFHVVAFSIKRQSNRPASAGTECVKLPANISNRTIVRRENVVKQHGCLSGPRHHNLPARFQRVRNRGERLMYIMVDDRENVANSYVGGLVREGGSSIGFSSGEFWDWLQSASEEDLGAVDAFLVGDFDARGSLPRAVRKRS